jgi:hypothetical protein
MKKVLVQKRVSQETLERLMLDSSFEAAYGQMAYGQFHIYCTVYELLSYVKIFNNNAIT